MMPLTESALGGHRTLISTPSTCRSESGLLVQHLAAPTCKGSFPTVTSPECTLFLSPYCKMAPLNASESSADLFQQLAAPSRRAAAWQQEGL